MSRARALPYHRKYRPDTLKGYIGNDKLKQTINLALSNETRPQVLLFNGASGCGKTTMARLVAKEYMCEDRDETTGSCGECATCKGISEYIRNGSTDNLLGVKEVDIAAASGKAALDNVVEDMFLYEHGWKVYILDECHEASTAAQNRLLKVVEEPPENVLIMFCTTNPEKMLETLKNRCQLNLKVMKPTVEELSSLSKDICIKENVNYDMAGLNFISKRADLTIRKNLQLLQQVIQEKNSATISEVKEVLEELSGEVLAKFLKTLKAQDTYAYVTTVYNIKKQVELEVFLDEFTGFLLRGIYIVNGLEVQGVMKHEMEMYKNLIGDMGISQMSILLNKLTSIDRRNLEVELLTLGYTGLKNLKEDSEEKVEEYIEEEEELSNEKQELENILQEKEEKREAEGREASEEMLSPASISKLIELSGAIVI